MERQGEHRPNSQPLSHHPAAGGLVLAQHQEILRQEGTNGHVFLTEAENRLQQALRLHDIHWSCAHHSYDHCPVIRLKRIYNF
jgi:hypothetical protein